MREGRGEHRSPRTMRRNKTVGFVVEKGRSFRRNKPAGSNDHRKGREKIFTNAQGMDSNFSWWEGEDDSYQAEVMATFFTVLNLSEKKRLSLQCVTVGTLWPDGFQKGIHPFEGKKKKENREICVEFQAV